MEDSIPETRDGQILSVADKLDTLAECFKIGLTPSGSKDPFGLRRAAQGIVKILVEANLPLAIQIVEFATTMSCWRSSASGVKFYFPGEARGFKYDEINAALAVGAGTLADALDRVRAVSEVRQTENFEPLAVSFKRIKNILEQAKFKADSPLDPRLFRHIAENELHGEIERVRANVMQTVDYPAALLEIASLRPAIDKLFVSVLVNDPDPDVRQNRLTLLDSLFQVSRNIADFSEIVTSGDQK